MRTVYSATPTPLEKLVRAPQQPAQVQVRIPSMSRLQLVTLGRRSNLLEARILSLSQRQLVTLRRRSNLLERAMVWRL
jgi:hypothetical protein